MVNKAKAICYACWQCLQWWHLTTCFNSWPQLGIQIFTLSSSLPYHKHWKKTCLLFCYRESISQIRIIRDNSPNQYMVLIRFREQVAAVEFYNSYHGKQFNSIEPEVCHLVYVERVDTMKESEVIISFAVNSLKELYLPLIIIRELDYLWRATQSCPLVQYV